MKNFLTIVMMMAFGPFVHAGNFGGGSTGLVEDEAVFFESIDYDLVSYQFAVLDQNEWKVEKVNMPLRGIDSKYVEALKASIRAKSWVWVKPIDVNCRSYEIVRKVNTTENHNTLQCEFPLVVGR